MTRRRKLVVLMIQLIQYIGQDFIINQTELERIVTLRQLPGM
jgi:hypothetical protein